MTAVVLVALLGLAAPISAQVSAEWTGTIAGRPVSCETTQQGPLGRADGVVNDVLRCRGTRWRALAVLSLVTDRAGSLTSSGRLCQRGGRRRRNPSGNPSTAVTRLRDGCQEAEVSVTGDFTPVPDWPPESPYVALVGEMTAVAGTITCQPRSRRPRQVAIDLRRLGD